MIRECSSREGRWQERCTDWQDNHFYAFEVQTQAKDYPYPFSILNAQWSVKTDSSASTEVSLNIEVEFKNALVGWLLFPIMKKKYLKICRKIMDNWEEKCTYCSTLRLKNN